MQDNTPGTDRNRHNQQSMTENVKEVLPGTKEHEGANEGLGHKIAKHIPGCVPCQPPCIYVGNIQELLKCSTQKIHAEQVGSRPSFGLRLVLYL